MVKSRWLWNVREKNKIIIIIIIIIIMMMMMMMMINKCDPRIEFFLFVCLCFCFAVALSLGKLPLQAIEPFFSRTKKEFTFFP